MSYNYNICFLNFVEISKRIAAWVGIGWPSAIALNYDWTLFSKLSLLIGSFRASSPLQSIKKLANVW
jgi:hypothetical protein